MFLHPESRLIIRHYFHEPHGGRAVVFFSQGRIYQCKMESVKNPKFFEFVDLSNRLNTALSFDDIFYGAEIGRASCRERV